MTKMTIKADVAVSGRGCLAYQDAHTANWGRPNLSVSGRSLRAETLKIGERTFKLVSYMGGEWEVYSVVEGVETFVGYGPTAIAAVAKA